MLETNDLLDVDFDGRFIVSLGNPKGENAVIEFGGDGLAVDGSREPDGARERSTPQKGASLVACGKRVGVAPLAGRGVV
jgi:hypothetical protein